MILALDKVNRAIFDHNLSIVFSSDEILSVKHDMSSHMSMVEQRSSAFIREPSSWTAS